MMEQSNGVNAFFLFGHLHIFVAPSRGISRNGLQPPQAGTDPIGMMEREEPQPTRKPGLALFSLALAFVLFNGGNTLKNATSTDELFAVIGLTRAEGAAVRSESNQPTDPRLIAEIDENTMIPQAIAPARYAVGDTISLLGGVFVMLSVVLLRPRTSPSVA